MALQISNLFRGIICAASLFAGVASASAAAGTPFVAEGSKTTVPYGWVDFCNRYAGECDGVELPASPIAMTAASLKTLEQVDKQVNASIEAVTDQDHWGVADRWDLPMDGKGDCEDYALLKRKILIERGFPRQALLITVVKDSAGEGHAILTAHTTKGDYMLDNLTDRVLRWDETGYRFVKRQSQEDPNRWVTIGVPVSAPLYTAR